MVAARAARQMPKRGMMMNHCQSGRKEPEEPDCSEPELAVEPEESLFMTPVRSEFEAKDPAPVSTLDPEVTGETTEFKELKEFKIPDPEEESHGVTVVVVTWKVATTVGPTVAAVAPAKRANPRVVLIMVAEQSERLSKMQLCR